MSSIPINSFKPIHPKMENVDHKLKDASKLYEKQFLREMVKSMRKTVSHGGLTEPSMAEKIFSEKLDQEYVESWGNTGGVGLGDIIYNQLKDRFFTDQPLNEPAGPIPLDKGSMLKVDDTQNLGTPVIKENLLPNKDMSMLLELSPEQKDRSVKSPWAGEVSQSFGDQEGRQTLRIDHDNGLVSTMHFQGRKENFQVGEVISSGQVLGALSPTSQSVSWRLVQVENS